MRPHCESALRWPGLPLDAVLIGSMTGSPATARRWQTAAVAFMVGRARGRRHPKGPNERGRLLYGMGSIRQRRKRRGGLRVLLSLVCERL